MPMIRFVSIVIALVMIIGQILIFEPLFTKKVSAGKSSVPTQAVSETTNLHYTGKYCAQCHEKTPVKGGNKKLKYGGDPKQLCRCHSPDSYVHPVDVRPSKDKMARMPAELPLQKGKISCVTCHDIFAQCQKRTIDKISLRGAPYPRRTDFCFKCHNKQNYMMLDVHKQLNAKKEIVVDKCLYCHDEKPDEKQATFKDLKYISDFETLCRRCHLVRGNHSGNFNHMIKPSAKGLAKMKQMEKKFGIILPLDTDGKMTCITCHNPHDKGVIPAQRASAGGAGSKFRHRLPGKLCIECHQM